MINNRILFDLIERQRYLRVDVLVPCVLAGVPKAFVRNCWTKEKGE